MAIIDTLYLGDGTPAPIALRVGIPLAHTYVHIEKVGGGGSVVWKLTDRSYPLYQADLVDWTPNDMLHFGPPYSSTGPVEYGATPPKLHYEKYDTVTAFWDLGAVSGWQGVATHGGEVQDFGAATLDSHAKTEVTWYGEPTAETPTFGFTETDTPEMSSSSGSKSLSFRPGMATPGTGRVDQVALAITFTVPGTELITELWAKPLTTGGDPQTVGNMLRLEFTDPPPPNPSMGVGPHSVGYIRRPT